MKRIADAPLSPILDKIETEGFAIVSPAFLDESVDRICRRIERPFGRRTINGELGYVQYGCRRYLINPLTWGREIIDAYTDPILTEICDRYSGGPVHLTSYRIYQTYASRSETMDWHVDNKTKRFDENSGCWRTVIESEEKSLSAMLFLTDVVDGGLEVVSGSHKWAHQLTMGKFEVLNDQKGKFCNKIVTCNGLPRGTVILFDNRIIHRGKPFASGPVRTVLLGQYQSERMPPGEPILLDTGDVGDLSEMQRRILRFGQASSAPIYPVGRPFELFGGLDWAKLGGWLIKDTARRFFRSLRQ